LYALIGVLLVRVVMPMSENLDGFTCLRLLGKVLI
jgi:hypothetical protein